MKESFSYKVFRVINVIIILTFVFLTLYPFLNIMAESFSSESMIRTGQVNLIPKGFNLNTYRAVLSDRLFWINYRNTLIYTVVGTIISMFLTTTAAYALSKQQLMMRSPILFIFAFTMFFSGGIIPNFILVNNLLGWSDTIWSIVIPGALGIFNLLIMKTFFENLPKELEEAAAIDGLSQYGIFLKIIMPLSKAVFATMILFYAVGMWNSWFSAFLYLRDRELQPVAIYLRGLIQGATMLTSEAAQAGAQAGEGIQINVGSVAIVLTSAPIIMIYPFLQKYFVQGIMLGSVK